MSGFQPSFDDRIATTAACTPIGLPREHKDRSDILTTGEWNRLARWLVATGYRPGDLLFAGIARDLDSAELDPEVVRKAHSISNRASATLSAIEALETQGIWVRCRGDEDYPVKWKKRLKSGAPPTLFGIGEFGMLCAPSVAIVGSRDVTPVLADTAATLGAAVANDGFVVISGAARGTDRYGMLGALEVGGKSIGLLAGSLQRISRDADLRGRIADDRLCLVSQVHPAAGFTVGNAMARNRLIYALSDLAIVVSTTEGTGGTWAGAIENLQRRWAPIAIWSGAGAPVGNRRLVELGGFPLAEMPQGNGSIRRLVDAAALHDTTRDDNSDKPLRLIQESSPPAY
jgi:predicted Rossmann fold nucleotide-binding protein DprA/Smf involved in DNA uptake